MQHRGPRLSRRGHGQRQPRRRDGDIYQGNIGWNVHSFVRRKLLSDDKHLSGIESGTEIFKGSGRLDTKAYSVDIG